jgi:hypothetical protein
MSKLHSLGYTQLPVGWLLGVTISEDKASGPEAFHSPLSSAGVKNSGAIPPVTHTSWRCFIN